MKMELGSKTGRFHWSRIVLSSGEFSVDLQLEMFAAANSIKSRFSGFGEHWPTNTERD